MSTGIWIRGPVSMHRSFPCFPWSQQPPVSQAFRRRHTRNDQTLARSPIQLVRCKRHHLFKDSKPLSHASQSHSLCIYICPCCKQCLSIDREQEPSHCSLISSWRSNATVHGCSSSPWLACCTSLPRPPRPSGPAS